VNRASSQPVMLPALVQIIPLTDGNLSEKR